MGVETIELAQPKYTPAKMQFPAMVSEKLDGVPVRLIRGYHDQCKALTRQGEFVLSIHHITEFFKEQFKVIQDCELIGELYIRGMPFKDISGKVRRQNEQSPDLVLNVFDMFIKSKPELNYGTRMSSLSSAMEIIASRLGATVDDLPIKVIPFIICANDDQVQMAHKATLASNPKAEGSMVHSVHKVFTPGKRLWSTQKLKPRPTIDIKIIDLKEAISEDGVGLRMVGGMVAEFHVLHNGKMGITHIGIGPGKLTHNERKALWTLHKLKRFKPRMAEVQYVPDDTYAMLREPTFQRWRDDKHEPDQHEHA